MKKSKKILLGIFLILLALIISIALGLSGLPPSLTGGIGYFVGSVLAFIYILLADPFIK